jgi:o-succinylbenzoate---CoA ligase
MDALARAALRDPGGEALAALPGRSWSWREADAAASEAALRLSASGVGPGTLVATLLPPSPEAFLLLHAVPRTGAVLVPLHAGWTGPEVARALRTVGEGAAHPLLLVLSGDAMDRTQRELREAGVPTGMVAAGEIVPADPGSASGPGPAYRPSDVAEDADHPVAVLLTSGSTGRPRPVPLTRGNLEASARGVAERLRLDPADRWLASLAPAHVGGLALLHRGAEVGSTTVFAGSGAFDAGAVLTLADAGEITHLSVVPVMLRRLLDARGDRPAPRGLRCVLVGGAPTPAPLLEEALARRWPVALTWGMTEAASQVATAPPDAVRRKPGSVGRPLSGVTVQVVDAEGRVLPRGEAGELVVAGPTVAPLPAVARSGGWHATGDLGRFDADGDLWITGRRSVRILSGGVTVEPGEVEAVLAAHPGVAEVAVAGVPDPEWGERVTAWVVPAPGMAPPMETELLAWGRERLASAKRPREIHLVAELPRTATGKVDRRRLTPLPSGD